MMSDDSDVKTCLCKNKLDSERELDIYYEVMEELVDRGGTVLDHRSANRQAFRSKDNDIDLVTETDKEIEYLITNDVRFRFPQHKFIAEEDSYSKGKPNQLLDDPTWIIDPVDGTMNYVHAFPHSCVSVGLVINKVTQMGMVYNPFLEQRFSARRGRGAFFNCCSTHVSDTKELSKALISAEFGTTRDPDKLRVVHENFVKLTHRAHGIRCLGSCALDMCMVALGVVDAFYDFGVHAWDVCAADLIVREAGGVVIDPSGGPFDLMSRRVLAASTPELAQELVKILTQFYPEPRDD